MKKIVLLVVWMLGFGICASAQDYQVNVYVGIKSNLNDVECGSHYVVIFSTRSGKTFSWYQSLNMGRRDWHEFNNTFYCTADDPIVWVTIWAKRLTSACKAEDYGWNDFEFPTTYPCGDSEIIRGKFKGYDGESAIQISVKPLSNMWVFKTDVELKMTADIDYSYTVTALYTDNTSQVILDTKPSELTENQDHRGVAAFQRWENNDKRVRQLMIVFRARRFLTVYPTQTKYVDLSISQQTGFDITLDKSQAFGLAPVGPESKIRLQYGLVHTPVNFSPMPTELAKEALPTENEITLSTKEDYPYTWYYSFNGTTFNPIPAPYTKGKQITLSATSFFNALNSPTGLNTFLFRNVYLVAEYSCGVPNRETEIVTLPILPSAPRIVDIDNDQETCYASEDATLKVKFSRPLYTYTRDGVTYHETVNVFLDGSTNEHIVTSLDGDNVLSVYNQRPGDHHVRITNKFGDLGVGYSEGGDFEGRETIPARSAVTLSTTPVDIHCHDGEDGVIRLTAQGGEAPYKAITSVRGADVSMDLTAGVAKSFSGLPPATYTIRLTDAKGCNPKDNAGNDIPPPQLTLNEPTQGVGLTVVDNVEPLGFGLTNGYVTVRAMEGTMPYTFSWLDASNTPRTANPSETEGASMKSTLANLGGGVYRVRVQDENYALTNPSIASDIRGCFDTLTVVVTEPPLLEVVMDQHRFVSCFDYTDGELVAHAKGGRPYTPATSNNPYRYDWFRVTSDGLTAFGTSDSLAKERPSALYRIRVTDRNGIIAWSPDYMLVQPDLLKVGFNTSTLLCNGDTNGTSEVLTQGGTLPYRYAWSTDETTQAIAGLTDGWYSVVVKDVRGCTTFGQTEVKVPLGLEEMASITPPLCQGYTDGSVAVAVSGGKLPYTYAWDNGASSATIANLGHGTYGVRITDANGCFINRTYTLDDPSLFAVTLGPDRVLCQDQTLALNVTLPGDAGAQYQWFKDGAAFASTAALTLSDAGTYRVEVRDHNGCFNSDEVMVNRDATVIDASIVVATRVPVGGRVRIANISNPSSERVSWIVPAAATVVEETQGYVDVSFNRKGEYQFGLTGYKGACEATTYTTVRVVGAEELTDYQAPNESYIKQFSASPNPNDGRFTVSVELREAGDFTLVLFSGQGTILDQKTVRQQTASSVDFDLSSRAGQGMYMLQLQTREGYATFKISVTK